MGRLVRRARFPRAAHAVALALAALFGRERPLAAQANVPQYRGDYGITSGTLPSPGLRFGAAYNNYRADEARGRDRTSFPAVKPTINTIALILSYTFPQPILDGHWNALIAVPWADMAPQTVNLDLGNAWGFSDLYVQPVRLGWRFPYADLTTGFGVFMPTGRFSPNAIDNTGFGMWSFEGSVGSTGYFSRSRQMSISALLSYQSNSEQRDTDRRAGNLLTIEGGLGHTITKDAGQFGVAYYGQWKTTFDRGFGLPPMFDARSRTFGAGPEVRLPFPFMGFTGTATMRYFWEFGSVVATQGDSFYVFLTLFKPALPRK